jgi:hypothetical protein
MTKGGDRLGAGKGGAQGGKGRRLRITHVSRFVFGVLSIKV